MKHGFTTKAIFAAFVIAAGLKGALLVMQQVGRTPSSLEDQYELTVNNISLDPTSRVKKFDHVFLRATFNQNKILEFGKNEAWKVERGESKPLAIRLDLERSWIKTDDSMDFQLEIVEGGVFGLFDVVLVRCAQVAREISAYNRSYQCHIPGEKTPVLSYRVARKGSTPPKLNVAQK